MTFGRNMMLAGAGAAALGVAVQGAEARTAQETYWAAFSACEEAIASQAGVEESAVRFEMRETRSHPRRLRVRYVASLKSDRDVTVAAWCAWSPRERATRVAFDAASDPVRFAQLARRSVAARTAPGGDALENVSEGG